MNWISLAFYNRPPTISFTLRHWIHCINCLFSCLCVLNRQQLSGLLYMALAPRCWVLHGGLILKVGDFFHFTVWAVRSERPLDSWRSTRRHYFVAWCRFACQTSGTSPTPSPAPSSSPPLSVKYQNSLFKRDISFDWDWETDDPCLHLTLTFYDIWAKSSKSILDPHVRVSRN